MVRNNKHKEDQKAQQGASKPTHRTNSLGEGLLNGMPGKSDGKIQEVVRRHVFKVWRPRLTIRCKDNTFSIKETWENRCKRGATNQASFKKLSSFSFLLFVLFVYLSRTLVCTLRKMKSKYANEIFSHTVGGRSEGIFFKWRPRFWQLDVKITCFPSKMTLETGHALQQKMTCCHSLKNIGHRPPR